MTFAWRAGDLSARPLFASSHVGRAPAFSCAGVLCALNAQADQITNALTWQSAAEAVTTLGGIAAVIWIAMYAALQLGFAAPRRGLGRQDMVVLTAVVGCSVLPISYMAQAGLLLCGAYLFATSRRDDPARRSSLVLLALTGPLIWGRILLQLFAAPVLWIDAHLAAAVAGTSVQGNLVQFANSSQSFLIGGPCSSVHNISLAVVLWTTAAAMFNVRVDRNYSAVGAAMAALMFGLNIARLALMAVFPAHFDFIHNGLGADLFGWAGLLGAALLCAWGVSSAVKRQR